MQSPYLERKGIDLEDLKRVCRCNVTVAHRRIAMFEDDQFKGYHHGNFVFRELVSLTNQRMGVERILDQRIDRGGDGKANDKFVTQGSDTSGFTPMGFNPIKLLSMRGRLIVCAGLAEGYRIHQATGFPVACAVGEGNIPRIAQMIASFTAPHLLRVSVAVDNDKAGRLAAYRSGLPYTMPRVEKDFSDVFQNEGGAEAVYWQADLDFPALPADMRERHIDLLMGRNNQDYAPPVNRMELVNVASAPMGVVGFLEVAKPQLIEGYDQFREVADSMGVGPTRHEKYDQWQLINTPELGLVMGMLDAGLHTSLHEIPLGLSTLQTNFFEAIQEGAVDDLPIPGGTPALVRLGEDKRGQCLVIKTPYDKEIASLCRQAKGFYDKTADEWRISVTTPDQCHRALDAIAGNDLRRFMFPDKDDDQHWVVATPWTRAQLADQMPALENPALTPTMPDRPGMAM